MAQKRGDCFRVIWTSVRVALIPGRIANATEILTSSVTASSATSPQGRPLPGESAQCHGIDCGSTVPPDTLILPLQRTLIPCYPWPGPEPSLIEDRPSKISVLNLGVAPDTSDRREFLPR